MMRHLHVRVITGLILATFVVLLLTLVPVDEYVYHSSILMFVYGLINLPIVIVAEISGLGHSLWFMNAAFFVWWFLLGFFGTWAIQLILAKIRGR